MDTILKHLEKGVRGIGSLDDEDATRKKIEYIETFRSDRPERWQAFAYELGYPRPLALAVLSWVLREDEFDLKAPADYARGILNARFDRQYDGKEGFLARLERRSERLHLSFEVEIAVAEQGSLSLRTSRLLPTWTDEFLARTALLLKNTPPKILALIPAEWQTKAEALPAPKVPGPPEPASTGQLPEIPVVPEHAHVVWPGKLLDRPVRGALYDYSGLAMESELHGLSAGALPLGRYTFAPRAEEERGKSVYIGTYRTGAPMIYNGALICAPQNSGKTKLILRWALAANRAGHNVFLVDVKGNLRDKIGGQLQGKTYFFSTDPDVNDCNRINFLSGLEGRTALGGMRIRQLTEALLPQDGWEQGEQAYFYQNHVNWLSGLIHILLLHQHYLPEQFPRGEATLGHLYEIVSNEERLNAVMRNIAIMEERRHAEGGTVAWPGLAYWLNEISLLIDRARGGQRSPEYTFRMLTQTMVNALRPFSSFGTLYLKTGGTAEKGEETLGSFFSFEELAKEGEPVTIILAAREQDLDDATTVVSMAVKKLQQFLFNRMGLPNPRPILLLLDETRRIRSFKANEYITFAREASAGCVVAYQSLDQIGEPRQITEILENIGTQIYLGSLVGNTAKYFIDILPSRYRPSFSESASFGSEGVSSSVQTGQEQVSHITSNELYRLPGGKWPALVYINDQPRRNPFLVDMDEALPEK